MILVDSNIPMYLVGAEHPNRDSARRLVERSVAGQERLVTDVGVLQEILHRYVAIARRDAIQPAFDVLLGLVDEVLPMELADAHGPDLFLSAREGCPPGMHCTSPSCSVTALRES